MTPPLFIIKQTANYVDKNLRNPRQEYGSDPYSFGKNRKGIYLM